jgi:beta-N-acetylhexosaminidase
MLEKTERDFFKTCNPLGFILFARNCQDPAQVKALTDDLKKTLGREAPVLIDQEGGRVRRLKPPHWSDMPSAKTYGDQWLNDPQTSASDLRSSLDVVSRELTEIGINVNCLPVLDILHQDTHQAIGDRAYSSDPEIAGQLGAVACEALYASGIVPVLKHLPGQGRAVSDSHYDLPVVPATLNELQDDFKPFDFVLHQAFAQALWGMVAHIVYDKIDESFPASCSRKVVHDIIRKTLKFNGLLLSDDICMGALSVIGDAGQRAQQVLRAGCDIALHCNGKMDEMESVVKRAQKMTKEAVTRYNRSVSWFMDV